MHYASIVNSTGKGLYSPVLLNRIYRKPKCTVYQIKIKVYNCERVYEGYTASIWDPSEFQNILTRTAKPTIQSSKSTVAAKT